MPGLRTSPFARLAPAVALIALSFGCGGNVVVDHGGAGGDGQAGGNTPGSPPSQFGTPQVACEISVGPIAYCIQIFGGTPQEISGVRESCQSSQGKIVPACSSSGIIGCCAISLMGITSEECFESGVTLSQAHQVCSAQHGTFMSAP